MGTLVEILYTPRKPSASHLDTGCFDGDVNCFRCPCYLAVNNVKQKLSASASPTGISLKALFANISTWYRYIIYTVYNVVDQFDIRSISSMAVEYEMCGYCRFQRTLQCASNHALDGVLPAEYVSCEASR